jgi:hypothetical protein
MNSPAARARLAVARIVLGGLAMVFAFTALYVAAFHAPRAKGFDVGVVGTPAQAARLQAQLDAASADAFDVRHYDTEPQARAALLRTDVHGVLVPGARRILVAEALGAMPTQAVTSALTGVASANGTPARVQDLRPLPSGDRRGLSSLFTVIGTLIPSLVFGALLSVLGRALPARVRWPAVVAFAALAGLIAAFDVEVLTGAFDGEFAGVALVAGLLALAVSAAAHGLGHLGGPPGIVLAILMLILLGMSSAGGAVTYQFEPGFYGAISQLLPPGAALTAVRNVEYFDWHATLVPFVVLGAWAIGGLALGLLGERFGPHVRRPAAPPTSDLRVPADWVAS